MSLLDNSKSAYSTRDDRDAGLACLVSWAKRHGAYVNDCLDISNIDAAGVSIETRRDSSPIAAASRLLTCPYSLSISYLNALDNNLFPSRCSLFSDSFLKALPIHTVTVFFLCQQYILGESSFWSPYLKLLPQPNEPDKLGTPLQFSATDKLWLKGTNLEKGSLDREEEWKRQFDDAIAHLRSEGVDVVGYTWCVARAP